MGIIIIIVLYLLIGSVSYFYARHFCGVSQLKKKTLGYLFLMFLSGFVIDIFIHRESVTLFVTYLVMASIASFIFYRIRWYHALALGGVFAVTRQLVVLLWAYLFNISL